LQENVPAHYSGDFSEFLAKRGIPALSHTHYSADIAPANFFAGLKLAIKGTRFEAVSSIQQTATRDLKVIREEAFSLALDSLYER
jgi:hypothetical protein